MSKATIRPIAISLLITVLAVTCACTSPPATSTTATTTSIASLSTVNTATITTSATSTTAQLAVHFIDVGQGDSILIDLEQTEVLIDGGDRSPGVVAYLNQYVEGPLEAMVATHTHADHIGGLIAVLAAFDVEQIWQNGDTSSSNTYADFETGVQAEQSQGAEVHTARRGDMIQVGDLDFTVLSPTNLAGSTNNNSVVLSLSYGSVDFLFTGDAEKEAEASMLLAVDMPLRDVEILKVGHHCSNTASSSAFLSLISPEVAVYMCKTGNSYGHPHAETIAALLAIGARIYGTDVNGTVVVTTDGQSYIVQGAKGSCLTAAPAPTTTSTTVPATTTTPPTQTTTSTSTTAPGASDVQITYIFYDGLVPTSEADEYVEIANLGTAPHDITGWVLKDISEGYPSFTFPTYTMQLGQRIRVYTNEVHPEWGGFSFHYGKAIWNNSDPDVAALFSADGVEVSRKSY